MDVSKEIRPFPKICLNHRSFLRFDPPVRLGPVNGKTMTQISEFVEFIVAERRLFVRLHEVADQPRDLIRFGVEREMASIEDVDLGVGEDLCDSAPARQCRMTGHAAPDHQEAAAFSRASRLATWDRSRRWFDSRKRARSGCPLGPVRSGKRIRSSKDPGRRAEDRGRRRGWRVRVVASERKLGAKGGFRSRRDPPKRRGATSRSRPSLRYARRRSGRSARRPVPACWKRHAETDRAAIILHIERVPRQPDRLR